MNTWPTVKRIGEKGTAGECLHIEAEGCIVNIRQHLTDMKGRQVTSIEIIPDDYAGEAKRKLIGSALNRVIKLKTKLR